MQRKPATALAASVAIGLSAASIYAASVVGVFRPTAHANIVRHSTTEVAKTQPVPTKPRVVTVYVDDPVQAPAHHATIVAAPQTATALSASAQMTSSAPAPPQHESEAAEIEGADD